MAGGGCVIAEVAVPTTDAVFAEGFALLKAYKVL